MFPTPPNLSKIHILLADGDLYMSGILGHMLHAMGFTNVTRVSNGQKARHLIETREIDILITEWSIDGMDGMDLAHYMRDPASSPHLTMPIIMMTGRAERHNVEYARDYGVTEFLVKPVTTAMLFDRIKRIFDHPRDFIIASNYIGPDRRHHEADSLPKDELRVAKPLMVSNPAIALNSNYDPIVIKSDNALRRKAHIVDTISSIVTPELLKKAEAVIQSYHDESTKWISEDIKALERAIGLLSGSLPGASAQAQNATLSLKSRAGMFGYDMASNVAFALYVFLYHDFRAGNASHLLIMRKHVEVMKVLLAGRQLGNSKQIEEELTGQLLKMTAKLKQSGPHLADLKDASA